MSTAIEFNHVSKQYRLGLVSTKTLGHDLQRWWAMNVLRKEDPYLKIGETNDRSVKGASDYVLALKDIDFKVEQGDVVGIIGKNGAGKSTLLKLLSKVTGPTTGSIRARGRIGSLLEVGTGFHPEMTGRENIFMNGAILGMNKFEIAKKLDEIVDFSGCERYLDTPVKRYSSGMMVRLGFAVAAHLDPEILVVDEVLAVGDAEFQKKAIGKMQDISSGQGRTVLFVSHNMDSIRRLCKTGIVLSKGSVEFSGSVSEAVDHYIGDNISYLGIPLNERADRLGDGKIRVKNVNFYNNNGIIISRAFVGAPLEIRFELEINDKSIDLSTVMLECSLCNNLDKPIVTWKSEEMDFSFESLCITNIISINIPSLSLRKGEYYLYFQIVNKTYRPENWCDLLNRALKFEVINNPYFSHNTMLSSIRNEALVNGYFCYR